MSSSDFDRSGWLPPDPDVEPLPLPPPTGSGRRRIVTAVAVVVVVLLVTVGVVVAGANNGGERSGLAGQTPVWPTPRPPSSAPATPTEGPRPVVWTTEPFLPELTLDLFARDQNTLYRIQAGSRKVVATRTLDLDTTGVVTFLAGPHQVLATNGGASVGWQVYDGQPATKLSGLLADVSYAVPGPAGTVWVTRTVDGKSTTTLTDFTGRRLHQPTGTTDTAAVRSGWTVTDGAGGLLLQAAGGTYQVTSAGPRRVTTGRVIATGRHHMLAVECDPRLACSRILLDRSGHRRRIAPTSFDDAAAGTISRTGRYAALIESGSTGRLGWDRVTIIDLDTATIISSFDPNNQQQDEHSLIWLPDNRLLGLRDGHLFVFDPTTKRFTTPNLRTPSQLIQLATRPTP